MKKRTLYELLTLILMVMITLFITTAYSVFIFHYTYGEDIAVQITVPSWKINFLKPGQQLIINDDGTATIIDDATGTSATYPMNIFYEDEGNTPFIGNGSAEVSLTIGVNEDGALSVTNYEVTPQIVLFSNHRGAVYFPSKVKINEEEFPVTAIAQPVYFETNTFLFIKEQINEVHIPENYTAICDEAFYYCDLAKDTTFFLPNTAAAIGFAAFNLNENSASINFNGLMSEWELVQLKDGWIYNSTNNRTTMTVNCLDGQYIYSIRRNNITVSPIRY